VRDVEPQSCAKGVFFVFRAEHALGYVAATAGFRAYHRRNLSRIDLDRVRADGYGFQVEMTYLTERTGGRITEVPIEFRDRSLGHSKMSSGSSGRSHSHFASKP